MDLKTTTTIGTTIDLPPLFKAAASAVLLLGSSGCGTDPLQTELVNNSLKTSRSISGCLEKFKIDNLEKVLSRCDATVDAYPDEAGPLSDRALVLSLKGDNKQACADVARGLLLLERMEPQDSDNASNAMLQYELSVRQAACKQERTMDANG